jgi:uncharacterized membrane protein YebE (DUF533 family)
MITSMVGAFGGGAVGRMLGGRMGGMVGSMAGSMLAGRMRSSGGGGGIGDLLGGLMGGDDEKQAAQVAAEAMPESEAMILIKAMCNAAKADGHVDDAEIDAIMGRVGDLEPDDEFMLRAELQAPLDLQAFLAEIPKGMEADVYAASLLPIEVDTADEVEYLQQLGRGLGLSGSDINAIHEELGLR